MAISRFGGGKAENVIGAIPAALRDVWKPSRKAGSPMME